MDRQDTSQLVRFELLHQDARTGARRGRLHTRWGMVETPAFMPVGSAGSVKAVGPDDLQRCGAQIILANTYHLMLRPGSNVVAALGGRPGHVILVGCEPSSFDGEGLSAPVAAAIEPACALVQELIGRIDA